MVEQRRELPVPVLLALDQAPPAALPPAGRRAGRLRPLERGDLADRASAGAYHEARCGVRTPLWQDLAIGGGVRHGVLPLAAWGRRRAPRGPRVIPDGGEGAIALQGLEPGREPREVRREGERLGLHAPLRRAQGRQAPALGAGLLLKEQRERQVHEQDEPEQGQQGALGRQAHRRAAEATDRRIASTAVPAS